MNYKFQSKFRNCAIVIKRAMAWNARLGLPAEDGYHLKFENGIAILPEDKANETVVSNGVSYTILELIRKNKNFGNQFFEVEEVKADITKTILPKHLNKTINVENGHFADPINPKDILSNPQAKELIMTLAMELAKNLNTKKEDITTEEESAPTIITEPQTTIVNPTIVTEGVNDDIVNWDNLTLSGREKPYANKNGLLLGLKAKGIEVLPKSE